VTVEEHEILVRPDRALHEGLTFLAVVDGLDREDVVLRALAAYMRARLSTRGPARAGAWR